MNDLQNEISSELIDFLELKDFSELTQSEKLKVTEIISEHEYSKMRLTIKSIKKSLNNELPMTNYVNDLFAKSKQIYFFDDKKKKTPKSFFILLLNKPIPVYSLILALFIFITFLMSDIKSPEVILKDRVVTIRDTVWVGAKEQLINAKSGTNITKFEKAPENKSTVSVRELINEEIALSEGNRMLLKSNIQLVLNSKIGKSIESDSALLKYLVSAQ